MTARAAIVEDDTRDRAEGGLNAFEGGVAGGRRFRSVGSAAGNDCGACDQD